MEGKKQEKKINIVVILLGIILVIAIIFGIYKVFFSNPSNNISVSEKDSDIEKMQNKVEELNKKIEKLQKKMDPELEKLNSLYEEYTSIVGQYNVEEPQTEETNQEQVQEVENVNAE